jgi:hypothetical protein
VKNDDASVEKFRIVRTNRASALFLASTPAEFIT